MRFRVQILSFYQRNYCTVLITQHSDIPSYRGLPVSGWRCILLRTEMNSTPHHIFSCLLCRQSQTAMWCDGPVAEKCKPTKVRKNETALTVYLVQTSPNDWVSLLLPRGKKKSSLLPCYCICKLQGPRRNTEHTGKWQQQQQLLGIIQGTFPLLAAPQQIIGKKCKMQFHCHTNCLLGLQTKRKLLQLTLSA